MCHWCQKPIKDEEFATRDYKTFHLACLQSYIEYLKLVKFLGEKNMRGIV